MIHFACQCGKKMKVDDEHAGQRVKCRACGHGIVIPGERMPTHDCFISHSSNDRTTAEAICATLEASGIRCWMAPRNIRPGTEYGQGIIEGINACRVMVVVFSASSDASPYVRRETERAVSKGLVVVPFLIEDAPMSATMEFFLGSPHWLDALTPPLEKHIQTLQRTVSALLAESGRTPARRAEMGASDQRRAAASSTARPKRRLLVAAGVAGGLAVAVLLVLAALGKLGPRRTSPEPAAAAPGNGEAQGTPREVPASVSRAPAVPPKPAAAAGIKPPVSKATLKGGNVSLQALGVNVRSTGLNWGAGDDPLAKRLIILSDQRDATLGSGQGGGTAELSFQINNTSEEAVTLSSLQLHLLGVVIVYEDSIVKPGVPKSRRDISVAVKAGINSPPLVGQLRVQDMFASNNLMFYEAEGLAMFYEAEGLVFSVADNSRPDLVTPKIDADGNVTLTFAPGKSGECEVAIRVANAFGQKATKNITVTVLAARLAKAEVVRAFLPGMFGQDYSNPIALRGRRDAVDDKKLDLGAVGLSYTARPGAVFDPCASGDLFPRGETGVMSARFAKPFSIRVACDTRVPQRDATLRNDVMVGQEDPRRRLVAKPPELVRVEYLLAITVHVSTTSGVSQTLHSDRLFRLVAQGDAPIRGYSEAPGEFVDGIVDGCVWLQGQTRAFLMAKQWLNIPAGADAAAISPWCYYADGASPLRAGAKPASPPSRRRWPRSNLAGVLTALRKLRSPVWAMVDEELTRTGRAETDLGKKARYMQTQMRSKARLLAIAPSYSRVETPKAP
ncbi:toll/interleukin-1 receptor domain-containing protein [bacterium]|nr:toll/interleukin-1 receptor domain-containing protein [bacterium]